MSLVLMLMLMPLQGVQRASVLQDVRLSARLAVTRLEAPWPLVTMETIAAHLAKEPPRSLTRQQLSGLLLELPLEAPLSVLPALQQRIEGLLTAPELTLGERSALLARLWSLVWKSSDESRKPSLTQWLLQLKPKLLVGPLTPANSMPRAKL